MFVANAKVKNIVNGRISTVRVVREPAKEWKKNKAGNWVWLYFVGQVGGFCSEDYRVI